MSREEITKINSDGLRYKSKEKKADPLLEDPTQWQL
jgi:hypothetical protein